MHSVVHVVASNDTGGNGQLLPNSVSLNAVPEQYFALKLYISVPEALVAQVYSIYLGQQSQSAFFGNSQTKLHVVVVGQVVAVKVNLCGQLGASLSLFRLLLKSQ